MQVTIPKFTKPKLQKIGLKHLKFIARITAISFLLVLWVWLVYSFYAGKKEFTITGELYAKTYNAAYKGGAMTYTSHFVMYPEGKQVIKSVDMLQSDWDKSRKGDKRTFTLRKSDLYSSGREAFSCFIGAITTIVFFLMLAFYSFKFLVTDENGKWPKWMSD